MTTYRICDTSIFRNLGEGRIKQSDIAPPGSVLQVSPSTVFELLSRSTEGNFDHQKKAAQAILSSGAQLLPDIEAYLAKDVFGFTLRQGIDWLSVIRAMALARSRSELEEGFQDYERGVQTKLDLRGIEAYRATLDEYFLQRMSQLLRTHIAKYDALLARHHQRGTCTPRLGKEERDDFSELIENQNYFVSLTAGCIQRALSSAETGPPEPPTEDWARKLFDALDLLRLFIAGYTEYLKRAHLSGKLPEANDWIDLDFFFYSRDDQHIIVTSDKRLASLAVEAGFPQRVLRV
jgi:hypothetical protein